MKKTVIFLMMMSMLCGSIPTVFAESENAVLQIHLSPDGSDLNDGTAESPVKTFERARELYRENANDGIDGEILVHGGIYRLKKSFSLNSADNGMKIKAYGDGEVSVRGSEKLSKGLFKKVTDKDFLEKLPEQAKDKIYEYDLSGILANVEKHPEYKGLVGGTAYYELYVGGEVQTIARWPNYGYAVTGYASGKSFKSDSERLSKWKNSKYAMVRGYWCYDWAMEHAYITDVDEENSMVSFSKDLEYSSEIKKGQRYYALNMPEEMDIPGEYYIDCDDKKLYYYPSEAFLKNSPELSVMKDVLFSLDGASNIEISGINFEYTRGSALRVSNGSNVTIDSCIVRNIGSSAISLSTYNSVVKNCEVYNLGGGGISVSSGARNTLTPGNCKITNNNVYNFGRIFRTYQAAIAAEGVGNEVTYNTIHDAPHLGIKVGGNDNKISNNEIYNIVFECSDSGGIYTGRSWTNWGNEISYNYLHDIIKDETLTDHTVSAVYLDDMMSGIKVANNVFENCTQAALFGGGRANSFEDNKIINCEHGINYDARAVTGNWAHGSVISGGTVYENVVKFLEEIDLDVWKAKYRGFSTMVEDIESYKSNSEYELGYPKDALVSGNKNYGEYAENEEYDNISEYVYEYGTVSENTYSKENAEIEIPSNGAEKFSWNKEFSVYSPQKEEVFDRGNVEFSWSRAGGADYYETIVTDENGERVYYNESLYNGAAVKILKKGNYNWSITAVSRGEKVKKSGSFTVKKNYNPTDKYFGGCNFEDTDLSELKKCGWSFSVAEGDSISVENDENGNGYLKMVRAEDNLLSSSATYAKMSFNEKTSGKITVTYDIMLENYRGGWRDMGSVKSKNESDIMRLLTHSQWVYGMNTNSDGYHLKLYEKPNNSYITVKREIDLDNGTYSIYTYQDGELLNKAENKACGTGEAENIMFRLQCQNPFEPCKGEGGAIYRIDNISVDTGELAPSETVPENDDYNVSKESEIYVKWNDDVKPESVNKDTVTVYENGTKLEDYSITAEKRGFAVKPENGLKYNSVYKIVIAKSVRTDSLVHAQMSENYEFSFTTEADKSIYENNFRVINTIPNNDAEKEVAEISVTFNGEVDESCVNKDNIKVYKYSLPIEEYTLSCSGKTITIHMGEAIKKGEVSEVFVSKNVLPKNTDAFSCMNEDYKFGFAVNGDKHEKEIMSYDFEDWNDFSISGACETEYKGWKFVLGEGDSVSVETDPVSGKKALKIQKGSVNSMLKVYLDYEASGDEFIRVRFDTRFENQSRRIHDWGSAQNKDSRLFLKTVVYGNGYWHRQIGDTKRWLCGLGESITQVEQILNYPKGEYEINIYKNNEKYTSKTEAANNKILPQRLYFAIDNKQDDYTGKATGDGVYWLENVSIYEIYAPKVEKITTDNECKAQIKFNRDIEEESVTKNNIKIYDNGSPAEYTLNASGAGVVEVEFKNQLKAEHKYRFEIDGILDENGVEMINSYVGEIECEKIFAVENVVKNGENTEIDIYTNVESFICIAVNKDSDGKLISCEILEGKSKIIHEYNPNTQYLFWESLENMKPLNKLKLFSCDL